MTEPAKPPTIRKIIQDFQTDETIRQQRVEGQDLDPQLALLRAWQSQRLAKTYSDLLASERFAPACSFFLTDIYAPRDFSQRNHDIVRIHNWLAKYLPPASLDLIGKAVEINEMTERLDAELQRALFDVLGVEGEITPALYAAGYRVCDNYAERKRQIDLLVDIGWKVDLGARNVLVNAAVKMARLPAQKAGWFELYDFLQRGYSAFRHMRTADEFINIIQTREMHILDRIFAGEEDPFTDSEG